MVTKRKDPSFTQVTSHVPKDLARRLKRYCADNDTTITDTVTLAIEEFLEKHEARFVENKPESIAQLVQQNFYQLLTDSNIKPESLKVIAAGEKPSNTALSRIANILNIREEELVSMREREFPSKRRQPNGQPT